MIEEMKPTKIKKTFRGRFPKSTADFEDSVSWQWIRSGYVK